MFLALVLLGLQGPVQALESESKSLNAVYTWIETGNLEHQWTVFHRALKKIYEPVFDQLQVKDLDALLREAFDEEVKDLADPQKDVYFVSASIDGKVVGWASFNPEGKDEIYIRHMVVDPEYQNRGIGKMLIFKSFEQLPQAKKIVLVTRRINKGALAFYRALGFQEASYTHEGLDPKLWVGYEYILKDSLAKN